MKTYTLHRVGLWSAFKFGFVVGLAVLFLPVVIGAVVAWQIVTGIAAWMAGLTYSLALPIPGLPAFEINGVELLKLQTAHQVIKFIANFPVWGVILSAMALVILTAFVTAIGAAFAAAVFNGLAALSGGLELKLSEGAAQPARQTPAQSPQAKPFTGLLPSAPAAAPVPSGPRFEITGPVPQIVAIAKASVIIGSDSSADIRLEGLQPRHAQLNFENGRYVLRDLSGGQSWVQGRPIAGPNMVKDGFAIQFGKWTMIFRQ